MLHFLFAIGYVCFALLPDQVPNDRYLDYALIAIAAIEIVQGINQYQSTRKG
jgi:hypothetical protein